jgi:hypothetical protein
MSRVLETQRSAAEEPERKATPHTAVLDPERRKDTGLKSGLIAEKDALYMAHYQGTVFHGHSWLPSLRLGTFMTQQSRSPSHIDRTLILGSIAELILSSQIT